MSPPPLFSPHLVALRHEEVQVVAGERHLEVDLHQPQVGRVAVEAVHADDEVRRQGQHVGVWRRVGVVQR